MNKALEVVNTSCDKKDKIDEEYEQFPSTQQSGEKYCDKLKEKYSVVTEDITDDESGEKKQENDENETEEKEDITDKEIPEDATEKKIRPKIYVKTLNLLNYLMTWFMWKVVPILKITWSKNGKTLRRELNLGGNYLYFNIKPILFFPLTILSYV